MRPVALSIEGLRSFRTPVEIDFQGRDNLAIIGDTGAGKSSILEAMTYALFGRSTFTGHANQEIVNDLSEYMRVTLRFTVAGRTFEVTRVLRRAEDRSVRPARASLTEFSPDGTEIHKVEQVRQVNDRVREVIGLDAEAFKRTVVLPQGQFAQLLVGDDPSVRAGILRQVWRTDELTRAGQLIDGVLPEVSQVVGQVTQALEETPDNPEDHLRQLRAEAERSRGHATMTRDIHEAAVTARHALGAAIKTIQSADDVLETTAQFDLDAATACAAAVASAAAELADERNSAQQQQQTLRDQLRAVPGDDDGLDLQAIGAARAVLGELPTRGQAITDAVDRARREAAEADAAAERLDELKDELRGLEAQLKQREGRQLELSSALAKANDDLDSARARLKAAIQAVREAETSETRAQVKAQQAEDLMQEAAGLRDGALPGAQQQARTAETHYSDAQRHNAAGTAASGLHPGDNCSVCNRRLPPGWQPPAAEDVDAARTAYRAAADELLRVRDEIQKRETNAEAMKKQVAELQHEAELTRESARTTAAEVAVMLGRDQIDLESLISESQLLQPLLNAAQKADEELSAYSAESQRLREDRAARSSDVDNARERLENRREVQRRASSDAATAVQALRALVNSLPGELSFDVALPENPLDIETVALPDLIAANQELDDRTQELDRRAGLRTKLQQGLERIAEEIDALDERQSHDVFTPGNELVARLNSHRDGISAAIAGLRLQQAEMPAAASMADPSTLVGTVRAISACTDEVVGRIRALAEQAKADAAGAQLTLDQLAKSLAISVTAEADPEEVVRRANERATEAEVEARAMERSSSEFGILVGPMIQLKRAADELESTHLAVKDLSAALKPGAFPAWLTLRRSRALLVHASSKLEHMSGGRYAFAELDDETGEWRVVDKDSNLARTPASLSGGEQFIASLSLALGMVEMMARSGGRLESLWLDEGFGSLDRSNLDAAIEALMSVASRGRMVAVISHIHAVAEQVTDVLAVTRSVNGSRARWLSSNERTRLATDDIDAESALAGLLE